jgi:GWxTD domain-containing protein
MSKKILFQNLICFFFLASLMISCASKGPVKVTLEPESQMFLEMIGYIILPVEEKIFREMPPEDRGEFIRDFWTRRDPDPSTPANEFRQTYYKRLQTADKAFKKGTPGWKSDRGMVYILLGPPTNVITKAMGDMPHQENFFGRENLIDEGALTERPTEIWLYDNYTDHFAGPLRLVFVDYYSTGKFKLTTRKNITAFSMLSPTWDPPDLPAYQWISVLELEKQNPGKLSIFNFKTTVQTKKDASGYLVIVTLDIPYKRLEYKRKGENYSLNLFLTAEVRDEKKGLLTKHEEPYTQTLPYKRLKNIISDELYIHREWTLDLPPGSKYIYLSVTDNNKGKRLRKLLEVR